MKVTEAVAAVVEMAMAAAGVEEVRRAEREAILAARMAHHTPLGTWATLEAAATAAAGSEVVKAMAAMVAAARVVAARAAVMTEAEQAEGWVAEAEAEEVAVAAEMIVARSSMAEVHSCW